MTKDKMNWLVEKYNNTKNNVDTDNKMEYIVNDTKESMGTIMIPTGGGKSGHIYCDIIKHIDNAGNKKYIFNISAPILKLEAQLLVDFFNTIKYIFADKIGNNQFTFLINSSDKTEKYEDIALELGMDILRFNKDNLDLFFDSNAQFAIVASCHKSLQKFIDKIDYINTKAVVVNYIDEGHLLNNESISHHKTTKEIVKIDSIKKFCNACNMYRHKFYVFSATPDQNITEAINSCKGCDDKYNIIYRINPIDLINKNIILPPKFNNWQVDEDYKLDVKLLAKFMEKVVKENDKIYHKILVTCTRADEVENLRQNLKEMGYMAFSTTSKYKQKFSGIDENGEEFDNEVDEMKFINDVDSYNGDCFVLHIKQLIQGIDIKGLTDAVICTASNGDTSVYKTLVQIIGRVLRPLNGERGMNKDNRKKKYGNVLFVTPTDYKLGTIENFLHRYYGMDAMTFITNKVNFKGKSGIEIVDDGFVRFSYDGDDEYNYDGIKTMLFNIENFIKETLLVKYNVLKSFGGDIKSEIESDILKLSDDYGKIDGYIDSVQLLTNVKLENCIRDMFKKYGVI